MPTTTTTVKTTTALLAATAALGLGAAGPATAAPSKRCGNVATSNGGKALSIRANHLSCASAKAIAKRANGKSYKASGYTCRALVGIYNCTKPGTARSVSFGYSRPS